MNLSVRQLHEKVRENAYKTILRLATEDGINASGKNDVYGCIFGRDSAITVLKILTTLESNPTIDTVDCEYLLDVCRRSLLRLCDLQGTTVNIESGEEPGKFIHEYRTENYDRLLRLEKPWYIYPDNVLRNYDSIDATPLALIALYKYWELTSDSEFLLKVLPAVEKGLNWIISYGDQDKDYLVEYELSPLRKHGGLVVQSWTDSGESLLQENGLFPHYPIAPVEVQGYVWLALNMWADHYDDSSGEFTHTNSFAQKLRSQAVHMKEVFNNAFMFEDKTGLIFPAQALDGDKNMLKTVTGNSLLLLWASYQTDNGVESILDDMYVPTLVKRSFMDDMFDPDGGIRTMSTQSPFFIEGQNSYHNGSFWPKLNGMVHEGLMKWGYQSQADFVKSATLFALSYFGTPIELYIKTQDGKLVEYCNDQGQKSCVEQAWSAGTALYLSLHT